MDLGGAETISQQQKLRVCDVCGAYLSVFDSDRRLAGKKNNRLDIVHDVYQI